MKKISEIIDLVSSRIGVKQSGEALDPDDANTILQVLKFTMDEVSIRWYGAKLYEKEIPGKSVITIGTDDLGIAGDIPDRPSKIDSVVVTVGSIHYPMLIKTYDDYLKLPITNVDAIPNVVYLREDFPYISLYFYPNIGVTSTVKIFGKGYMTDEDLRYSDFLDVPREYIAAIVAKVALKVAPYFMMTPDQSLVIDASAGEKHIKAKLLVERMNSLQNDFQVFRGGFNPITGRAN